MYLARKYNNKQTYSFISFSLVSLHPFQWNQIPAILESYWFQKTFTLFFVSKYCFSIYLLTSRLCELFNILIFWILFYLKNEQEELKRAQDEEREKRAAAAERRMAALKIQANNSISEANKSGLTSDIVCSCCNSSLAGKVPFHRYNYKYCSTSCMHVHREILEDG